MTPPRRFALLRWCRLLAAAASISLAAVAGAQESSTEAAEEPAPGELRLLDRSPSDLVRLRSGETLKIRPLAERRLPANPRPGDKLAVELPEFPGEKFEVAWKDIAELKFFEQQLLEEAQRLAAAGQRDEAYEYFQVLRARYPKMEGLQRAVSDFLALEAASALEGGAADHALGILYEIQQSDSNYPELEVRLGEATDRLVESYLKADDLATARLFLQQLAGVYPEHPVVARWNGELDRRSRAALANAARLRAEDAISEALLSAHEALRLAPESQDALAAVAELTAAAAWAPIAVSSPARAADPASLDDWASRRVSRLLAPGLYELVAYSSEGGEYATRFGQGAANELEFRLTLQLRSDLALPSGGAPLLGSDVAIRLLQRAEPNQPTFQPVWAQVFESVAVRDVYDLEIRFRQSGLRPQALLQFPILADTAPSSGLPMAYAAVCRVVASSADSLDLVRYAALQSPAAPRRLTERHVADAQQAAAALDRGDVVCIDRVAPWLAAPLARNPRVAVEPYAVPTICVLIPNAARPLAANRTFRRAVQYGIHRSAIVESHLVRGPLPQGTQVVSGPFPTDSYAWASEIAPRDYEPYLAKTLLEVALAQTAPQLPPRKEGEPIALVLSHPPNETARLACQAMERQLERLGLAIELVEQEPSDAVAHQDYDFRYAELFVAEPAIDAFRLFGPGGMVAGTSAYLQRAIRQLSYCTDWPTARRTLHQIHKLVHEELAVIPLYQLREHLARDRRLTGVAPQPVGLYVSLERWQIGPWSPLVKR